MQAWFPTGEPIHGRGSCMLDLAFRWPFQVGAGPTPHRMVSYNGTPKVWTPCFKPQAFPHHSPFPTYYHLPLHHLSLWSNNLISSKSVMICLIYVSWLFDHQWSPAPLNVYLMTKLIFCSKRQVKWPLNPLPFATSLNSFIIVKARKGKENRLRRRLA